MSICITLCSTDCNSEPLNSFKKATHIFQFTKDCLLEILQTLNFSFTGYRGMSFFIYARGDFCFRDDYFFSVRIGEAIYLRTNLSFFNKDVFFDLYVPSVSSKRFLVTILDSEVIRPSISHAPSSDLRKFSTIWYLEGFFLLANLM